MLVTVYEYEQNISRDVGRVAHTRFWVVRSYEWTDVRRSANLNANPQFCAGHNNEQILKVSYVHKQLTILQYEQV